MKEQLRKFITDNFLFGRPIELSDDDSLQDAGIIDSTGVLELVAFIEETYRIQVRDHELLPANLDSINRLAAFLRRKMAEGGAGAYEPQPA
jgi:acyl carrier protein